MRAMHAYDLVPAVVFSTSNHPHDRRRCLNCGASDYLVKPPHFVALLNQVREMHARWLEMPAIPFSAPVAG